MALHATDVAMQRDLAASPGLRMPTLLGLGFGVVGGTGFSVWGVRP